MSNPTVLSEMLRPNNTQLHLSMNNPTVFSTSWGATSKQHSSPPLYDQSNGVQYFLRCYVHTALISTLLRMIQWCPVLSEVLRPNSTHLHIVSARWDATLKHTSSSESYVVVSVTATFINKPYYKQLLTYLELILSILSYFCDYYYCNQKYLVLSF